MEAIVFWKYFNCIGSLKSTETLEGFIITSYPQLKNNKRKELFESAKRNINKVFETPKKSLATYEDTMAKLKGVFRGK